MFTMQCAIKQMLKITVQDSNKILNNNQKAFGKNRRLFFENQIMEEVTIHVENENDALLDFCAPTNMGLSLLELLKANDVPIQGICRGTAFCATCHVYVTKGIESLAEPSDIEQRILNMLPNKIPVSRLSCRVKLSELNNGFTVKIPAAPMFF